MGSNRLADASHSAEQMLVLSAVILIAVAMLIASHLLGARHKSAVPKPIHATDAERTLAGVAPVPEAPVIAAPVPAAAATEHV